MHIDLSKFDNALQVGGIRTGSLDYPNPCGGQSCRVAHVNTGSGLRFTVAIDRGGDIVEAAYNATNLAYLSPNDYKPPSPAYMQGLDWLRSWPGGLVTTAGPLDIGEPRTEAGRDIPLHGHHSNLPAAVLEVVHPNPRDGQLEMRLSLAIRDTQMFGPALEVRREIVCQLGEPVITIRDKVTNIGDDRAPHAWLYHCNLGYPLVDEGASLIYGGTGWLYDSRPENLPRPDGEQVKRIPAPDAGFSGPGEQVVTASSEEIDGMVHVGLINDQLPLGVEFNYRAEALPGFANWLHFGPRGSYVTAIEPFMGSLFGRDGDDHPTANLMLDPGESRQYELKITVHSTQENFGAFRRHDRPLVLTAND